MKNRINSKTILRIVGIIALAAVIGFSMTACASTSAEGAAESDLTPNASSAIVYFVQPTMRSASGDIIIWDGETPVGKIKGGFYGNVAYRARPGAHTFMSNRFNWSKVTVQVRANTVYYIKLDWAPNPVPFSNDFALLSVMTTAEGQELSKKNKKSLAFSDDWRAKFKSSLSPEYLAEMRKNLRG